ncbi:FAD-binding oxidoreductase [Acrocarpospora macrocephala]|uniref:Glycolate oxidase n=1 Tax=Acrocarpospora macrocephala TaxID=150177 RepID=A0A5M3X176_9ACTN|nr:FAD-binding oxidoreductase [Acrocarpospora macrocephala]GES15465.1 glycolate oxidase [Acrocarpospora macrocephala]
MPHDALAGTGVTIRTADPSDAVAGVQPKWVALPESTEEVAALLRAAAEHDLAVTPVGGGTKLDWGPPPERCDLLIDLCCMNEILEHAAGDLVVRVQAGTTFESLNQQLSTENQELALDIPVPGTTVGGLLATALSGPRRFRYGTPRDLVIGITVVLADGTTAHSGGKVVKNVAGYDLGKLFTGSYGTLGIITEAAFRLHPLPPTRKWVTATYPTPEQNDSPADYATLIGALVTQLAASQAEPSAIELNWSAVSPGYTMSVLLEGTAAPSRAAAIQHAMTNLEISGIEASSGNNPALGLLSRPEITDNPPEWWGDLPDGGILMEIRVPPGSIGPVLRDVASASMSGHVLRGSAASGVLHLAVPDETHLTAIARLRDQVEGIGGRLVVVSGAGNGVDRWGTIGALDLMKRVKARFDPDRRLSPGRFVGGI